MCWPYVCSVMKFLKIVKEVENSLVAICVIL